MRMQQKYTRRIIMKTVSIHFMLLMVLTVPAGTSVAKGRTIMYDELDRVIEVVNSNGSMFKYDHDGAGNILSVTTAGSNTTPPQLSAPEDIRAYSDPGEESARVYFTATAEDVLDGVLSVECLPPSGSTFHLDTTTVICKVTNSRGISVTDSFFIVVTKTPAVPTDSTAKGMLTPVAVSMVVKSANMTAASRLKASKASPAAKILAKVNNAPPVDRSESGMNFGFTSQRIAEPVNNDAIITNVSVLLLEFEPINEQGAGNAPGNTFTSGAFTGIIEAPATGFYKLWMEGAKGAKLWMSNSATPEGEYLVLEITSGQPVPFIGIAMSAGERRYIKAESITLTDNFMVSWDGPGFLPEVLPGKSVSGSGSAGK